MVTLRAKLAITYSACLLLAGCQSNPTIASLFARLRPAPAISNSPGETVSPESTFVLEQGMMVYWDAQPSRTEPGQVRNGTALVGPDGNIVIGPYGACKVAGLSVDQAQRAVEQHLAAYLATPRVRLSMTATAEPTEIAWRPSQASMPPIIVNSGAGEDEARPGEAVVESQPGVQTVIWRR
jgi:hypothetical protein